MDDDLRHLRGSKSRDHFKWWHKQKLRGCDYASDLDLILVEKVFTGTKDKEGYWHKGVIVAAIDFKSYDVEEPTFTEVIVYNWSVDSGVPVYLVSGNPALPDEGKEYDTMMVRRFVHGVPWPRPPKCEIEHVIGPCSVDEYVAWEKKLRGAAK